MSIDHEFITPLEKTQCQVHLTSEKVQGNLPQCSHTEESRVEKHFPTEKACPQDINQFKERRKLYSGSLIWKKLRDEFLKQILKQECKVDLLDTSTREFQRQAHSNRLEMDSVNHGYEESRREQATRHEELAQREKALRETHIRSIDEVEELKRAQEMRIDEFSKNEKRESHAAIQELTSQIQELQARTALYERF